MPPDRSIGRLAFQLGDERVVENEESGTRTGMTESEDNVVQLPRDWLGPREELVPFGPRARPDDSADDALAANDFWGENSHSLHGVVQGAAPPGDAPTADERDQAPVVEPSHRGHGRRLAVAAGLAAVALAVILIGLPRHATPRSSAPAAAASSSAPARLLAGLVPADRAVGVGIERLARERLEAARVRHSQALRLTRVTPHVERSPAHVVASAKAPGAAASTGGDTAAPTVSSGGGSTGGAGSGASPSIQSPSSPTGTTAASSNANSQDQPAFGANGTLGPGSSPNG